MNPERFTNFSTEDLQVICHRGLCAKFPQNTKEAILGAIDAADLAQLDILLTKDHEIIVFHDRTLDRITDVNNFQQFSERKKTLIIDERKEPVTGHWVRDFDLAQLKRLSVRQTVAGRPELPGHNFEISTMEEIIQACLNHKKSALVNTSGLLIEIKSEIVHQITEGDKIMCRKLVELLRKYELNTFQGCQKNRFPIVIQSFNKQMLQFIEGCQNQIVQLFEDYETIYPEILTELKFPHLNIRGIGVGMKSLLDSQGNPSRSLRELCDQFDYSLKFWTIIDDSPNPIPYGCATYQEFYITLAKLGVTGFITEFPENCFKVLRDYCGMNQIKSSSQSSEMEEPVNYINSEKIEFEENLSYEEEKIVIRDN